MLSTMQSELAGKASLRLPEGLRRRLVDAATAGCPEEICGALLGTAEPEGARVSELVPLANRATDPRRSYRVAPADLEPLLRGPERAEVIGFYHSHPSGPAAPSDRDFADAWPGYWYVVIAPKAAVAERVTAWRNAEGGRIGG